MTSGVSAASGALTRTSGRRDYIDVARGIAVLIMIEAHAIDAWTRDASKHSLAFRDATILGGFAAPLFLWLAGVSAVLAAARMEARAGNRRDAAEAICRRGLEIFILAFLFRLQAFVVSPGSHPVTLFRVDILNIMGPAIALTGLLWASTASNSIRLWAMAMVATAIAMTTPIVRAAEWVGALPTWLQWYARPAGEHTTFTLFPWIGFVFAGGAVGALIADPRGKAAERRLHVWIALAGVALVVTGFAAAARPSIYVSSSFWTSSPTWFAIRAGVLMLALAALYSVSLSISVSVVQPFRATNSVVQPVRAAFDRLARMGRSSLFIYWIHVELVYGYASWLWRGRLPLWGTLTAWAAFSTLMYGAVVLRDRVTAAWRARPAAVRSATA